MRMKYKNPEFGLMGQLSDQEGLGGKIDDHSHW